MSCFFLENDFSREYIDYYILKKANRKKILILKNDKIRTTKHNNIYVISINFNFLVQLFFLFFNGKYVYSTTPDLNNTYFVKSIFRAIENNTFLVRSANKGISAIIDNKGNIVKQLNRNEAGNIEFEIPLIKSNKNKNDLIFFSLLITYLFIFLINKKKNDKK